MTPSSSRRGEKAQKKEPGLGTDARLSLRGVTDVGVVGWGELELLVEVL